MYGTGTRNIDFIVILFTTGLVGTWMEFTPNQLQPKIIEDESFYIVIEALAYCRQSTLKYICIPDHYLNATNVNLLWLSDVLGYHRTWSTLVQEMAWCRYYMNQCWLIVCEVLWHLPEGNFVLNGSDMYHWYACEHD